MLRRKFYAVLSKPVAGPGQFKALVPAHLEYMIELEKRGVLFASGPLADGDGDAMIDLIGSLPRGKN